MSWNDLDPLWQLASLAVFIVAFSQLAHRALRPAVQRLLARSNLLLSVMKRCDRPVQAAVPLALIQIVLESFAAQLPAQNSLQLISGVLFVMALTWLCMGVVQGVADGVIALHPADSTDNLAARRIQTQTRVLSRIATGAVFIAGFSLVLMSFPSARQFGASLLASAGVVGLVVGIAARSLVSNLLAGLQIALAEPIRIDDVLIVEGEWGRVEEITATYLVLKIWDDRRLIIPLGWFIEHPFQNWTRTTSDLLGTVFLWVDYSCPVDAVRNEARRICEASPLWDRRVCLVQVTDTSDRAMQLRVLVSSASSGSSFDLRCEVREKLISYVAQIHPQSLATLRARLQTSHETR